MAGRMCVDCSVFDPVHGMNAHPIFQTREEWENHLKSAHGVGAVVATETVPVTNSDRLIKMVSSLEARITALENQDTGLMERIDALESRNRSRNRTT